MSESARGEGASYSAMTKQIREGFRRQGEDPTRMFAGEGTPERTNHRFHLLCRDQPAARLSTAFDMPTLMGYDSDSPKARGETGKCGVAIDTLKDMEDLFAGIKDEGVLADAGAGPGPVARYQEIDIICA